MSHYERSDSEVCHHCEAVVAVAEVAAAEVRQDFDLARLFRERHWGLLQC
jgi:hypothetical protein